VTERILETTEDQSIDGKKRRIDGKKRSIYCAENKHFNRIVEIMDLLNNPDTVREERQKLSYERALMSYHSEEK